MGKHHQDHDVVGESARPLLAAVTHIDETVIGFVTMEDLLEALVGQAHDSNA